MCSTCIYRPNSPLSLEKLENDVRDKNMKGFFDGYRVCHHTHDKEAICCRGFWEKHKDNFTLGQVAQRLGFVEYVDIDILEKK